MIADPAHGDLSYYPAECTTYDVGDGLAIVRNMNDGEIHQLSGFQANLLTRMIGCQPLSKHAQYLSSFDDHRVSAAALYRLLEAWVEIGLLRPRTRLQPQIHGSTSALVSACLTCDRPELLRSWIEERATVASFNRAGSLTLILDDTRGRSMGQQNRKTVAEFSSYYGERLFYMDRGDREVYCQSLAHCGRSAGVPEDVLRFALLGDGIPDGVRTTGANRNTLLLLTAGYHMHSSDDDMGYRFARFEGTCGEVPSLTTQFRMPIEFFPDLSTMKDAVECVEDYDLLSALQNALTHTIDLPDDLEAVSPALTRRLERGNARIRGVSAGYYGARHHVDPNRTLASREEYSWELIEDERAFRKIRAHGHNVQHAGTPTLDGTGFHFPGGTIALDNSSMLPPYPPGAVHQDSCWRRLEQIISPGHLFVHLPIAVYHDPLPKAQYAECDFRNVAVNLGMYTLLYLQAIPPTLLTLDESTRLREIGDRFVELARSPLGGFEEVLRHLQVKHLRGVARRAARELDQYEARPEWWAGDIRAFLKDIEQEVDAPDSVVPWELRGSGREKGQSLALVQQYFGSLGELLRWWPTIWQTAYRYNTEGHGLVGVTVRRSA